MRSSRKKIGLVASSGGHWEELLCLRELTDRYDAFFVTERGAQTGALQAKLYRFAQIDRGEPLFIFHFLWVSVRALWIVLREQPDAIVTTGALLAFPFCAWAKLCGKKVIYLESAARVQAASLTGRLVGRFADLFLVQWESMLGCCPRAVYAGRVL